MNPSVNVYNEPLEPCSYNPNTGFFRNGCCDTSPEDFGSHTICVETNEDFLKQQRMAGNDLVSPMPQWDFPGLRPGDKWCLCASRWLEAYRAGLAPKVFLRGTHKRALEIVPLEVLERFAVDVD